MKKKSADVLLKIIMILSELRILDWFNKTLSWGTLQSLFNNVDWRQKVLKYNLISCLGIIFLIYAL